MNLLRTASDPADAATPNGGSKSNLPEMRKVNDERN